jgi:hypothetical protein
VTTASDSGSADDNLVRDLYLFFELVCQRCGAGWEPGNLTEKVSGTGEAWAEAFAAHFGPFAQAEGWRSIDGNVLCPTCLGLNGRDDNKACGGSVRLLGDGT